MPLESTLRRSALTVFVCLLALAVSTLAVEAKSSQYEHLEGPTGRLAKQAKFDQQRTQKSVPLCPIPHAALWLEDSAAGLLPTPPQTVPHTPAVSPRKTRSRAPPRPARL